MTLTRTTRTGLGGLLLTTCLAAALPALAQDAPADPDTGVEVIEPEVTVVPPGNDAQAQTDTQTGSDPQTDAGTDADAESDADTTSDTGAEESPAAPGSNAEDTAPTEDTDQADEPTPAENAPTATSSEPEAAADTGDEPQPAGADDSAPPPPPADADAPANADADADADADDGAEEGGTEDGGPAAAATGTTSTAPSTDMAPADTATADTEATDTAPTDTAPTETGPAETAPSETAQADYEIGADWPYWGGDADATRYSPLSQITPENVGQLERAFVYNTGDMPSAEAEGKYAPETTPLKYGDALLMCSAKNVLISIDAATGEENWRFDPGVPDEAIPYSASCRGVSLWTDPDAASSDACATRVIEGTIDAKLVAVDAETGAPCEGFGENGTVDLWQDIGERVPGWYAVTAPPAIVRGVVVTGAQVKDGQAEDAPSGVVRGYDARTGALTWAWDLAAPEENRDGPPEGEVYTRGTPNMWTTAVADEELGYVYLPLGNSSVDYYGSNRSEAENEWATSLVALDVTTGEPAWSFQTVRHDVWDYDLGSQATLVDFPVDEGTRPAVILPSKQGDIYILDRATGESLFPAEDIEVPTDSGVEPEFMSPTQPVSGYHTLRFDPLTERDMWGMSPIDQLWCRIQFRRSEYQGFYQPPTSDRPWIQYPGYNGGSDWGSVAVDTERGILIANYNNVPNHNRLIPREEADERGLRPIDETQTASGGSKAEGEGDPQAGAPYAIDVNAGWRSPLTNMPCTQPPYGGIRAIDLETGETLWDQPIGTARRNGPWGIPSYLPFQIGTPNNGGSVVTAGGLVFIGAATDNLFRAIDIETGEVLWTDTLPAGGQANPITYEVDGKQYVLIAPGGHHFMETGVSDAVISYALPD
ncbi:membrane-bound PQQ-dependent dehydrogenase, glucose/quinate/shikimate family [Mesobaculum littorinae]|uniref:Membrane-bound PQQ-dependent dehydrogenase, glucose/quinate/shikimate family n=1 Tax=Mesobaculum littorinae TaxID=2486419 RepID=A0A438ALZ2_9RHOB|nr:PQQ-binding-like beta-propeller repeat protein [Mesobaculum littorinae]RVV99607.1 membrane-bound PQQ-dependent dehydrogenase, glucose/quinate/shikimate family [Mesobaculum littorinae]